MALESLAPIQETRQQTPLERSNDIGEQVVFRGTVVPEKKQRPEIVLPNGLIGTAGMLLDTVGEQALQGARDAYTKVYSKCNIGGNNLQELIATLDARITNIKEGLAKTNGVRSAAKRDGIDLLKTASHVYNHFYPKEAVNES